jgi:hypothetical protein
MMLKRVIKEEQRKIEQHRYNLLSTAVDEAEMVNKLYNNNVINSDEKIDMLQDIKRGIESLISSGLK